MSSYASAKPALGIVAVPSTTNVPTTDDPHLHRASHGDSVSDAVSTAHGNVSGVHVTSPRPQVPAAHAARSSEARTLSGLPVPPELVPLIAQELDNPSLRSLRQTSRRLDAEISAAPLNAHTRYVQAVLDNCANSESVLACLMLPRVLAVLPHTTALTLTLDEGEVGSLPAVCEFLEHNAPCLTSLTLHLERDRSAPAPTVELDAVAWLYSLRRLSVTCGGDVDALLLGLQYVPELTDLELCIPRLSPAAAASLGALRLQKLSLKTNWDVEHDDILCPEALEALGGCEGLKALTVKRYFHAPAQTSRVLARLTQIRSLRLPDTAVFNLDFLPRMPKLEQLELRSVRGGRLRLRSRIGCECCLSTLASMTRYSTPSSCRCLNSRRCILAASIPRSARIRRWRQVFCVQRSRPSLATRA